VEIWLRYDLRRAPFAMSTRTLIGHVLEQVAWADKQGFHTVQLSEHHGFEDGYNPSPLVLGGAVAALTSRMRLNPPLILPLYDPVRLAEDCCILDNISGGRLDITAVAGYTASDFAMMGISLKDRAPLQERALDVLVAAFNGRPFSFEGRTGKVMPLPAQPGGPPLFIGGSIMATAKRAAKYGAGYYPMDHDPKFVEAYKQACAELGKPVGKILRYSPALFLHVAEDPDADWAKIAPHALHEANAYYEAGKAAGEMNPFPKAETAEELRATGSYLVLTPDQCVDHCRKEAAAGRYVTLAPMTGGLPAEMAFSSLDLFATKVMPHIDVTLPPEPIS